jgi:hypothetical protein
MDTDLSHVGAKSTLLQKALAVAIVVSSISVPITTAWIAGTYADQNAQREANTRLIELAVTILQQPPKAEAVDIRAWALDVLAAHSDVKIPEAARASLARRTSLPSFVVHEAPWEKGKLWLGGEYVQIPESALRLLDTTDWRRRIDTSTGKLRPK